MGQLIKVAETRDVPPGTAKAVEAEGSVCVEATSLPDLLMHFTIYEAAESEDPKQTTRARASVAWRSSHERGQRAGPGRSRPGARTAHPDCLLGLRRFARVAG